MQLSDPPRLVVDLEGWRSTSHCANWSPRSGRKIPTSCRCVGQNRPKVARLVFDLKSEVAPQLFTLAPVGQYRHRLVLDLHPVIQSIR